MTLTLAEVKNYLNVTWDDAATDEKLGGIIARAEADIVRYAGAEPEWSGEERQLALDLCRYIFYNSYEDFYKNFAPEILALRNKYAVAEVDADG